MSENNGQNTPPPPAPADGAEEPPGICAKCDADVPVSEIKQGQGPDGKPGPKLHVVKAKGTMGVPCGPVATVWLYRVIAWVQPQAGPGLMKSFHVNASRPIRLPQEYVNMEGELADQYQARDPKGGLVIGIKPEVTVVNLVNLGAS